MSDTEEQSEPNSEVTQEVREPRVMDRPELIIQSILPIIQIFYSQFPSLLFKKLSPIIQVFQSIIILFPTLRKM